MIKKQFCIFFCLILTVAISLKAQIINTIAGTGFLTYCCDGGPATSAQINYPNGVGLDAIGNVYFADVNNSRIRKIDTAGIITTIAGTGISGYSGDGGLATSATFNDPREVVVDAKGNVYIADGGNRCIRKIDTSGIITTIAGTGSYGYSGDGGPATSAELKNPEGVLVDAAGNIYIADTYGHRIRKIDLSGIITTIAGTGTGGYSGDGGPATSAQLYYPRKIDVDAIGNVFIADGSNNRIRKINSLGIITTIAGTGVYGYSGDGGLATAAQLKYPEGVLVDAVGNVYITDTYSHRIRKINISGIITTIAGTGTGGYSGDGGPATSAQLKYPDNIDVDTLGNTYIADANNHCIRKIDTLGIITTIAGPGIWGYAGNGGPATSAQLNYPEGVQVDALGNIYIADANNNRIRKIDTSGIITTIAGTGTEGYSGDGGLAINSQLSYPAGIDFDNFYNLYFADKYNNCIRKIDTLGIITTIAGTGTGGYSGDGGPATSAQLDTPNEVDIDALGNVYVVDRYNNRIRKIDTAGIIATIAGTGTWGYSGDGGLATSAELAFPAGVVVDASGNVYIADQFNSRVRKVDTAGIITTIAGTGDWGYSGDGGPAASAKFGHPYSLAMDTSGNLYITDSIYHNVRKIDKAGIITTIAGTGIRGFSGDGGPSFSAQLNNPFAVELDALGNVYIADMVNHRIRKITYFRDTILFVITQTNVNCNGFNDGTANVSAYAGKSPYTYKWNNGITTQNITSLTAGTYYVTVTDANNIKVSTELVITEPVVLTVATYKSDDSCSNSAGIVTALVKGGTVEYSYKWTTGDTTQDIINLSVGSYTVTVIDAKGCKAWDVLKVFDPTYAYWSFQGDSCLAANSIQFEHSGTGDECVAMTCPTYYWNFGDGTTSFAEDPSKSYTAAGTFTVLHYVDDSTCLDTVTKVVTIIDCICPLSVSAGVDKTVCTGDTVILDGDYSIASYATKDTVFSGTGGAIVDNSTNDFSKLVELTNGTITNICLDITHGWNEDLDIYLINPCGTSLELSTDNGGSSDNYTGTCFTDGAGTSITAGSSPFTGTFIPEGTGGISSLASPCASNGTWILRIIDDAMLISGTLNSWSITFNYQFDSVVVEWSSSTDLSSITSLTPTYTAPLMAGVYEKILTVTDSVCTKNDTVLITVNDCCPKLNLTEVITNLACNGVNTGEIDLSVTGGTEPYIYKWSIGATTEDLNSLAEGTYIVTVIDIDGCDSISIKSFSVTQPTALTLSTTSTNLFCLPVCNNNATGIVTGGTSPYTYKWASGETTQTISSLCAGTYTVTATDSNGCKISDTTFVSEPLVLSVIVSSTDVTCFELSDGTASASGSGGTGNFSYAWNTGATSSSISGLSSGNFTVTATDDNNCTITGALTIMEPVEIIVMITKSDETDSVANDGAASTSVGGGTVPYSYNWSDGATSESVTGLNAGTYTVTVTDNNGCQQTATVTIDVVDGIQAMVQTNNFIVYPNPTKGKFILKINKQRNLQFKNIELTNILGEKVKQINVVNSTEVPIDISDMPQGVYILQATTAGQVFSGKIYLVK